MTDIDVRLKENNDALIQRIDKRMDVIDNNLNNKLDTTIANSKLTEIISKMDENNQNLKTIFDFNDNVIANKLNETETLWANSMTTILDKMELSKKTRKELAEELNSLKMKLSRSRGEEYKQTLEKYNKLKAKLKEMNE
jgi:ribosomal protein L29